MNIFFLSVSTINCAIYHCDKHCVKMILETCQLLYTCLWLTLPDSLDKAPLTKLGTKGYKKTHQNHPCAIWVRESLENYKWLCKLGLCLCQEYSYRYGKVHSCEKHIKWLAKQVPKIPNIEMTKIRQAMPDKYKCRNPVLAYRNYYMGEKRNFCKWTKRDTPYWFN